MIFCCKSFGSFPSIVHPTERHVPRISFTAPASSFAIDLVFIILMISITSSNEMLPTCLIFLFFFRSHSGSFKALITNAPADGTTSTVAWRFWTVSLTGTLTPFQSFSVYLAISSAIFFGRETEWTNLWSEWTRCSDLATGDSDITVLIFEGSEFRDIMARFSEGLGFETKGVRV